MPRQTKTVTLPVSKTLVTFKERLTFGESEELMSMAAAGAKVANGGVSGFDPKALVDQRARTVEVAVSALMDADGKVFEFSRGWLDGLDAEDGRFLVESINESHASKKN